MVVESTADILAIIGGATTFIISVFGVIRYSRCTEISCCGIKCHRNVVDKRSSDGSQSPREPREGREGREARDDVVQV